MNDQRVDGAAQELKGGVKQVAGELTGDDSLRAEGGIDRISGAAMQAVGSARDALAPVVDQIRDAAGPAVGKARALTRERPWAVAALIGVVGMAIVGSMRGRGKA